MGNYYDRDKEHVGFHAMRTPACGGAGVACLCVEQNVVVGGNGPIFAIGQLF